MGIKEIIKQPEGRRLEFKEALPVSADLANTIIESTPKSPSLFSHIEK